MNQAKINPLILQWARRRLDLTEEQLAQKIGLGAKPQRLQVWERGQEFPTFRQAQALAHVLHIPFGYLFLSNPPTTALPIPDFRTLPESERGKYSPELEDVLNDALRKRDWLRGRRIEESQPPLPFIGKFSMDDSPQVISAAIRHALALPVPTARDVKSTDEHLRFLVRQAEYAGIMVLQSGYALSNTHRTLSVQEFRGFALTDPYAPLIFLNAKDTVNGRIFTFAHELGHLWTGTSGISNPEAVLPEQQTLAIERLCNQVAAELLVPASLLIERLQSRVLDLETFQDLAQEFRVSVFVVLIRGYETGQIEEPIFRQIYHQAQQEIREFLSNQTRETAGGDFYRNFRTRNGRLLVGEVAQAVREGTVLYKEASELLNTKPQTLINALQEF
ncbi:MAG TPA: XRE family transcriptional regulator [Anaerolineae bacterium]|nr:XRE family transcriptional regulator [Anaerolineae bacterium]HQH39185.1 XRE family transcriptional regulator [Anaerolineae bacterium]